MAALAALGGHHDHSSSIAAPSHNHSSSKAALGALDEVRRQLLQRGCEAGPDEIRLAATLSRVSKHLADRNRSRVSKLLDGTDPASLAFTGLAAVWERGVKEALVGVGEELFNWSVDLPLTQWYVRRSGGPAGWRGGGVPPPPPWSRRRLAA